MSYTIDICPSGRSFVVAAEESVLDAALRQDVSLPYGCRSGSCGSCKGQVMAGEVSYPNGSPEILSEQELMEGWTLFCQASPTSDLSIAIDTYDAIGDLPKRTLPCRVSRVQQLNHDVIGLWLSLPATERLQFVAGQYIEITMKDGRQRAFSLANAPHDDDYLQLHIRCYPGGAFSDYVQSELKENAVLRITGPFGQFYLREDLPMPALFVAGGTGFAPVKGIIEHALASGSTRPLSLYWGARTEPDLYMHSLASQWAEEFAHVHYIPVLSEPESDTPWSGRTGFVHDAVLQDFADLSGFQVYASGPPVMVEAVATRFAERGFDTAYLFSDAFEFAKDGKPA